MTEPPLYDVENALREVARNRCRANELTAHAAGWTEPTSKQRLARMKARRASRKEAVSA